MLLRANATGRLLVETSLPSKTWYDVWCEGFVVTGQSASAKYLGRYRDESFPAACRQAMQDLGWDERSYNETTNSYWGCRFYDNEQDARKNFG